MEEHVQDLLPGYALGCLDEEELLQVARHLSRCRFCRAELEVYGATVDQLALVVSERIPSPQLKEKIMAQVEQHTQVEQEQRVPANGPERSQPAASSRVVPRPAGGWLANLFGGPRLPAMAWGAVAALLLITSLAVSNLLLWGQVNQLQARVPADHVQIVSMAGTSNAPDAHGYLMVFDNEPYGTLVVEDAPHLEAGFQYQLWLILDGKRTSGGVFSVDELGYGTLQVDANQPLENYPSFGVTIEPTGGSPGPTGKKVLGGDL